MLRFLWARFARCHDSKEQLSFEDAVFFRTGSYITVKPVDVPVIYLLIAEFFYSGFSVRECCGYFFVGKIFALAILIRFVQLWCILV